MKILLAVLLLIAPWAQAQDAYPSKSVRLIAAAAPGGNPDVLARMLAAKLADAFGRPFVVENAPGAGGVVAAEQVARAAPDGHTLMLGDSGANLLGFLAGAEIVRRLPEPWLPVAAATVVGLNLLAETVTFSRTIEAIPPLRWFDRLGRLPEATS